MELLQLRYFLALAESEHVSETAETFHVTQSSLSKTLQRLEGDIGAPLFDRAGRNVRLNAFGQAFLARARRALQELEEGRRELQELVSPQRGLVRLAVTTASILPGLLRRFRAEHPEARFHVEMIDESEVENRLRGGDVDYALSTDETHSGDLEQTVLLIDPILLAVPIGHALADRTSVELRELAGEDFIGLKAGFRKREVMDAFCCRHGLEPRFVYEGDEPARVNSLVEAGLGVAFVPATSVRGDRGVRYLPLVEAPSRTLCLVWSRGRFHGPVAQDFRDLAVEYTAAIRIQDTGAITS